eukprot:1138462-Pelagomonas_calceolata.AAC.3
MDTLIALKPSTPSTLTAAPLTLTSSSNTHDTREQAQAPMALRTRINTRSAFNAHKQFQHS